jgi:hypothetical protein
MARRLAASPELKGRRYRYYVCQPAADGSEAQNKPIRLPELGFLSAQYKQ